MCRHQYVSVNLIWQNILLFCLEEQGNRLSQRQSPCSLFSQSITASTTAYLMFFLPAPTGRGFSGCCGWDNPSPVQQWLPLPSLLPWGARHSSPGQVFTRDICAASIHSRALSKHRGLQRLSQSHFPLFLGEAGQVNAVLAVLSLLISFLFLEKALFYIPEISVLGHRSNCQIWANWLHVHPPGVWAAPISCCFRAPSSPCWAPSELWGHRNAFSTNVETRLEQLCKTFLLLITGGSPIYLILVF